MMSNRHYSKLKISKLHIEYNFIQIPLEEASERYDNLKSLLMRGAFRCINNLKLFKEDHNK